MNHVFWTVKDVKHGCSLRGLVGYKDQWKLLEGMPHAADWTDDRHFDMNPDFPNDTLVPDCVRNQASLIVVSSRLRDRLQKEKLDNVEFLEVTVRDHKGKNVQPPNYIVNPVGTLPLLRVDDCGITWDEMDDTAIDSMARFEIDAQVLASAPLIFRAQFLSMHLLVKRELAKALEQEGFTGMRWIEPKALAGATSISFLDRLPPAATAKL